MTASIAQDVNFSQFNLAPMVLNPALTAADVDMRGTLNYRTQWKGIAGNAFNTMGASYESKLDKISGEEGTKKSALENVAAGINIVSDRAGDGKMGYTQANLNFATHVPLKENMKLGAALSGGLGQRSVDFGRLTFDSQYNGTVYDPSLGTQENVSSENFIYQDLAAGIFFNLGNGALYSRSADKVKLNAGLAMHHLNRPKMSYYADATKKMDIKTVFHGGLFIPIGSTMFDVAPNWVYTQQGKSQEITAGILFKANLKEDNKLSSKVGGSAISLGAAYRVQDAIIVNALIELGQWGIGFSYDLNASDIKKNSGKNANALEFALRYISPNQHGAKAPVKE